MAIPQNKNSGLEYEYKVEKGLALILWNNTFSNSKDHLGSGPKNDRDTIATILAKFNIEVMKEGANLTKDEVKKLIPKVKERINREKPDIFVCMVSTHGGLLEKTKGGKHKFKQILHYFLLRDGEMVTEDLTREFDDQHCEGLTGKPRLFIIETCHARHGVNPYDEGQEIHVKKSCTPRRFWKLQLQYSFNNIPKHCSTVADNQELENTFKRQPKNPEDNDEAKQEDAEVASDSSTDEEAAEDKKFVNLNWPFWKPFIETTPSVCYKDSIVVFASPPGKYALSNHTGWLVYSLSKAFSNLRVSEVDIMDVLTSASFTMVKEKTHKFDDKNKDAMKKWGISDDTKIVPYIQHMLTKDLIFKRS